MTAPKRAAVQASPMAIGKSLRALVIGLSPSIAGAARFTPRTCVAAAAGLAKKRPRRSGASLSGALHTGGRGAGALSTGAVPRRKWNSRQQVAVPSGKQTGTQPNSECHARRVPIVCLRPCACPSPSNAGLRQTVIAGSLLPRHTAVPWHTVHSWHLQWLNSLPGEGKADGRR